MKKGIKFHNGKEMTSEDVVPSLKRWGARSVRAKNLFAVLADIRAVDKYTVEIKLKEQLGTVVISLAVPNNFAAIYPKEVAEKFAPEVKATEYIGTGPFKLAEFTPAERIRLVRNDRYHLGPAKLDEVDRPTPAEGQVLVMVHCGSRGLGHQVATDYTDWRGRPVGVPPESSLRRVMSATTSASSPSSSATIPCTTSSWRRWPGIPRRSSRRRGRRPASPRGARTARARRSGASGPAA